MKKLIFAILMTFSFIIFPFINKSSALEVSAGVATWYAWWENVNNDSNMNLNPALLYGPIISLRFDESWSLAGVFLYGRFSGKDQEGEDGGPDKISRYDSDISLNYNINRYFKIFTGGKFMGFSWDENQSDGKHWSAGPGLGLGATFPLTQSFYLLFNISGTYSWGKHDQSNSGTSDDKSSVKLNERGFNSTLSFAYYIASASTSINLGFRYHYFYIDYAENDDHNKDEAHNFFGPTLSVVYSF